MVETANTSHDPPARTPSEPWERIAPVLAAIGTGIGVIGFVAFVGGAVQYGRFRDIGLPVDQAVSVVPTADLIVVGGRALVPGMLIALGLVALLYFVRSPFFGWNLRFLADDEQRDRAAVMMFVVVITDAIGGVIVFGLPSFLQAVVLLVVSLVSGWLVACVVYSRGGFAWMAAGTFLAVSTSMTVFEYFRARAGSDDVRPAAVIRDHKAVTGYFVAESNSRVYIARLSVKPKDPNEILEDESRLVAFSKDDVTDLVVGPPMRPGKASVRAEELARELCSLRPPAKEKPPAVECYTAAAVSSVVR